MPFGEVRLVPGVNLEKTPTLLEAGYSSTQLGRFRDGLFQKLGGWVKYFGSAVSGVPRELHAWEDLNGTNRLGVGTTTQLAVITSGSLTSITPKTKTTNPNEDFTTVAGSADVTIVDAGISNVTTFDSVLFNTPVAVGGLILSGLYAITSIVGATSYKITAATAATTGVSNSGAVASFVTVSGSATVTVTLVAHGLLVNDTVVFPATTTVGGVTIQGLYVAATVPTADTFTIVVNAQATSSTSGSQNGGLAQFVYYINLGPPALGSGYGTGAYGAGGYGTGTVSAAQTGTPITATDWTSDNWGRVYLACPSNGGIYQYDPSGGFTTAGLVPGAPIFNGGIFVSMAQQILVAWGSTATQNIGIVQDPLLVKWSTVGDYADWVQRQTNQAGEQRLSTGSMIKGGAAVINQDFIWTDLDLWAMNYSGPPFVFGFVKIGAGAGLVSSHALQQLRGGIYWMGPSNFYSYTGQGVAVIPCPVWDVVFQNLNTTYVANVRAMPNTPFNEVGWLYPSSASANGENDSYVKFNITEPGAPWDYGTLARSAWIDQTVLGNPVGANPTGVIYQHEQGNDNDNNPMSVSMLSGYFYIAEGEEFAFVDQIYPDFKFGTYSGSQSAQINISFYVVNYPGDTPTVYGPYPVTSSTQYIATRMRGRQMAIFIQSNDLGSFWRIGKLRYRYAPSGRR